MTFKEMYDAFAAGKKIRRASWPKHWFTYSTGTKGVSLLGPDTLLATDWEIVEEKPKTKTVWQWRYWSQLEVWIVDQRLMSRAQAKAFYEGSYKLWEIHQGPFEVEVNI